MRIGIALLVLGAIGASAYLGIETRRNRLVWDHFDVVKPDILYRSGQLNPDQLEAAVRRYGLRTVVNFQRPGPGVAEERAVARRLGVDFLNLPMTGDGFGREDQFREVLKACDDPDRRPVLIHCARGTCRTGAAVALYRYERDGWTIEDVSQEMKRQSYKDGWLPGYVLNMSRNRPGPPIADPPIAIDRFAPARPAPPAPPSAAEPPLLEEAPPAMPPIPTAAATTAAGEPPIGRIR